MTFKQKIETRYQLKASKYFYRGTNFITKEQLEKTHFFDGDGHFGRGMYLTPDADIALSYIDKANPEPYLSEYEVHGKILEIENNDPTSGLFNANKLLNFSKLDVPKNLKHLVLKNQEDLGKTILEKGYDAVLLLGDYIDGGNQLLIPTGSKATLKIKSIESYAK